MPRITFLIDVTLPGEPGGPHYRRGYAPDVSEAEARKWIAAGAAAEGVINVAALQAPPPIVEAEPEPQVKPAPRLFGKRKS